MVSKGGVVGGGWMVDVLFLSRFCSVFVHALNFAPKSVLFLFCFCYLDGDYTETEQKQNKSRTKTEQKQNKNRTKPTNQDKERVR